MSLTAYLLALLEIKKYKWNYKFWKKMYGKCTQKKCVVKRNMKIQIRGNERKNLLRLKRRDSAWQEWELKETMNWMDIYLCHFSKNLKFLISILFQKLRIKTLQISWIYEKIKRKIVFQSWKWWNIIIVRQWGKDEEITLFFTYDSVYVYK